MIAHFCFEAYQEWKCQLTHLSAEKEQDILSNSSDRFKYWELITSHIDMWFSLIQLYSKKPYEAIFQTCSCESVLFMDWYKQAFLIHSLLPSGLEKMCMHIFLINYFKYILIIFTILSTLESMLIPFHIPYITLNQSEIYINIYLEIIYTESTISHELYHYLPEVTISFCINICHNFLTGLLACNLTSRLQLLIFCITVNMILLKYKNISVLYPKP